MIARGLDAVKMVAVAVADGVVLGGEVLAAGDWVALVVVVLWFLVGLVGCGLGGVAGGGAGLGDRGMGCVGWVLLMCVLRLDSRLRRVGRGCGGWWGVGGVM